MDTETKYRDLLIKPMISEKTYMLIEQNNSYVFQVHPDANKIDIRKAVEKIFNVHVLKVNIQNYPGKPKRLGMYQGKRSAKKKAIVKLREGETLPFFETV